MDLTLFDRVTGILGVVRTRRAAGALAATALAAAASGTAARKRKHRCLAPTSDLQVVVNGTAPGATVRLCAGVFPGLLDVDKDLKLLGAGAGKTFLSGEQKGTVLTVAAGHTVVVSGVTITGGEINGSSAAGGVDNSGTLTLAGCAVRGNFAYYGAGAMNRAGARLTLDATTVAGNQGVHAGGGVYNEGDLVVRNGSVIGSTQASDGNTARFGAGIANNGTGTGTFAKGTKVTGNAIDNGEGTGTPDGAGIYNSVADGVTLATTSIVTGNTRFGSPNNCGGPEPVAKCLEEA